MPGSPPTKSTEPRTKPPPVTRSCSAIPDGRRGACWESPVSVSSVNRRPLRLERTLAGMSVAAIESSSDSVFHSPQPSHLPCHLVKAEPQFWQTKEGRFFAIGHPRTICSIFVLIRVKKSTHPLAGWYQADDFSEAGLESWLTRPR